MANNIIRRTWKQSGLVNIEDLRGSAFQAEQGSHTFLISGVDENGEALALSGTPAGVLLRSDGQDVALTCSVLDGIVSATLPANAYVVPGRVGITIFLTNNGQKVAIYAAVGSVATTSSGTVAPPAGSDVVDLVNAISTAVATIPASYTDLMAAVAPTYSTSALYAVGSYAWYDGKLYRCTTAITSGETWTSGHWTLANLGSDVNDLKSALDYVNDISETVAVADIIQGSYGSKAVVTENSKRIRTQGTIRVMPGTVIEFAPGSNASRMIVGKFGEDLSFISDSSWYTSKTTISIEDNVGRIVLAFRNEGNTNIVPSDFDATVVVRSNIGKYMNKHAPALQNGIVGLRGAYPGITMNGTTAVVTFSKAGRAVWNNGYYAGSNTSPEACNVLQDQYLVYNTSNDTFSVKTSVSNITADEIILIYNAHGVLFGQWGNLYMAQKSQETADNAMSIIDQKPLPSYYDSYISGKITTINTIGASLPAQSGRLVFITDYHMDGNENNSPALIRELIRKTGIKNIAFNGDALGSETTALAAFNKLCSFVRMWNPLNGESHIFYVTGNHEYNNPSSNPDYDDRMLTMGSISQLFNNFNNPIIHSIKDTNAFYYDDYVAKIRYYFIDCDSHARIDINGVWTRRKNICDTLYSVPEGFAMLIISHAGLSSDDSAIIEKFGHILAVFAARDSGGTATLNNEEYDFNGQSRTFIGALTGHTHIDGYVYYDGKFPVIATICDAHTQTYTSKYAERTAGTTAEQAFDVVQIDVPSKRIYMTRIGYGSDRTFSFGETGAGLIT